MNNDNKCEHKTGTVLLNVPGVQITQCDWGCGALLVSTPMVDCEVQVETAGNGRLRERAGELEAALKNISDKVNAAATALNYPESPEEDSPIGEAYNHGFWDCAEMAIKEINAALVTAEGGE